MPVKTALNLKSWTCVYMRKNISNPGPSLNKKIGLIKQTTYFLKIKTKKRYVKEVLSLKNNINSEIVLDEKNCQTVTTSSKWTSFAYCQGS